MEQIFNTDRIASPLCLGQNSSGDQMQILYITFIDYGFCSSGSSARPHMMLDAFLSLGLEVSSPWGLAEQSERA